MPYFLNVYKHINVNTVFSQNFRVNSVKPRITIPMMACLLSEERCRCEEFVNTDPANKVPTDRLKFLHYVRHGPAQPTDIGSTGGRTFQTSWLV